MAIDVKIDNVDTIRLFGSHARGEESDKSDYDILVVLKKSQQISTDLERQVKSLFDREISISWYSMAHLKNLFKMGHLFSWHLYLESKQIVENDFISRLGKPEPYNYAFDDVKSLIEILKSIKQNCIQHPKNLIYECGLLYVCARNIAICSLPALLGKISFSVDAPYILGLPLSKIYFDKILHSRYSSTRGYAKPNVDIRTFTTIYDIVLEWANEQLNKIEKRNICISKTHARDFKKELT